MSRARGCRRAEHVEIRQEIVEVAEADFEKDAEYWIGIYRSARRSRDAKLAGEARENLYRRFGLDVTTAAPLTAIGCRKEIFVKSEPLKKLLALVDELPDPDLWPAGGLILSRGWLRLARKCALEITGRKEEAP